MTDKWVLIPPEHQAAKRYQQGEKKTATIMTKKNGLK